MTFTDEEYAFLTTVEDKMYTACYCQFVRIPKREQVEQIDVIYKRVFNSTTGLTGSCSHCALEIIKKLGKIYFAEKKERENAQKDAVETVSDENEPKTQQKTQKAATAKKTAKKTEKKK